MTACHRLDHQSICAEDVRGYDRMVEISKGKLDGDYYYERDKVCHDGEIRSGIWVPYGWWISRPEK